MKADLIYGECLAAMARLADHSIDLVLADLPYGSTQCKWDIIIPFAPLWREYARIGKPRCPIILTGTQPFAALATASNIRDFRYDLIWEKTAATGHLNANKMPMRAHESILVFYKQTPCYNPIKTSGHARKTAKSERFRLGSELYGKEAGTTLYDSTDRYPRSVLKFPSDKQKSCLHPCQKPVALMEWLVRTYCNPGDTVLDNTMGSGTTGIACLNTGRNFIGIEQDKVYFETAKNRFNLVNGGKI